VTSGDDDKTVPSFPAGEQTVDTIATGDTSGERTVDTVVVATDEEKTVVDGPSARPVGQRPPSASLTAATPTSGLSISMTTAEGALHFEEVERTRAMIRFGWIASVLSIAAVPLFGGHPVLQAACIGALTFGILGSIRFYQSLRDPDNLTERAMFWISIMCAFNAQVSVVYLGNFSAATMIMVAGLYFLARTGQTKSGDLAYLFAATIHAIPSVFIISGLLPDYGVYAPDPALTPKELFMGEFFIQTCYFFAYFSARLTRRASLESIHDLQGATRLAAQREVLLQELRHDLDRALKVGGPGRYTEQVLGSYKLGVVIGRGAMGEVYEASHVESTEVVAVKLLHRELLADQTHVARFLREARAASALDSPYVVKVIAASEPEEPVPYLAMERLTGITLSQLLRRQQRLRIEEVIELVEQIGSVIDGAKQLGIVHRDLKPQNIRLAEAAPPRMWKVLDFGVSTLNDSSGTLTQGGVVGTPTYMSPEQARSDRVDHRADLYALAAIVYRCLVGRPPYAGKDLPSLLYQAIHEMPVRPSVLASVPKSVEYVLAVGLAKNRDDRFDSGADMCAALRAASNGELSEALTKRAQRLLTAHPWRTEQ
jgi:serine/threonine-protein kinase